MDRLAGSESRSRGAAPTAAPAGPRVLSITRRLALSGVLVLGVGGAAVAVAILAYGRQAAQQSYDRLLVGAANEIAGALLVRSGALVIDIPASAFELLALAPEDRILYAVYDQDGRLLTGYATALPPRGGAAFGSVDFAGETARTAMAVRRFSERDFVGEIRVVVGQTTRARDAMARAMARRAFLVIGGIGALTLGLAAFGIRSALAPLRRIEAGLARREPRELTPLDVAVPREISHLVAAINRFMAQQARQIDTMRTLIADASHQLRTPVAAIRAQAELAADEPDMARQKAIVARIRDRSVGLGHLTDQLLSHALVIHRAEAVPHAAVDLRAVAIRIVEACDPDEAFGLGLDLAEEPTTCRGDMLSLVEAGKNLVNNALRHGRPPVAVIARAEGREVLLAVRDAGPGMPEAVRAAAGQRFGQTGGITAQSAGIGLAIVSAVAVAHRGLLRFEDLPGGGFEAVLALPALAPGGASDGAVNGAAP